MALVITVAQQKGGTGKTTVAANLAIALAGEGLHVALLDADTQQTLVRWHDLRNARTPPVTWKLKFAAIAAWRLGAEITRLKREVDAIVIDSPPQITTDARVAIRAADLVLVPVQPSPPDLWAAEGTLALAQAEKRPLRIVLNRVPSTSRLRQRVESEIAKRGLPRFAAALGNRSGFALAFAEGLGVTEQAPRSAAATEVTALVREVREITT